MLALRHAIPAGGVVRSDDVRRRGDRGVRPRAVDARAARRVSRGAARTIALAAGDFLVRGALRVGDRSSLLRRGERAVALRAVAGVRARPGAAPRGPPRRRRDRVERSGSRVVARGLELLSQASERAGSVVVTLRAPTAVALALAGRHDGRELRLLVRGERT